ncbi:MAG: 4-(cytidine 5'-diphospho)-2-C-methyl-D-erythritol kinase [Bacteroidetes bacterium]|nr:MAG: 4-(cytidine 5'-diphospho)-2-C-methyl-D-erythritol kinase [Bacteroidota bacterium]TAG90196.1 MAG: 4-(cytidine 5'-diphospho)-2-C-methyl-D-erythritol kinase [Bacteroidota bacterium]
MLVFPNAKINIGLHILRKRNDNFHDLETLFYPVQWTDALEIITEKETEFFSSGLSIPSDNQDNLCLRAYHLLKKEFNLPNVHIFLHKIIPTGAGLGGGSADASFTLKVLKELFDLPLSFSDLENYATKLGSDCAFFIKNKPQIGTGRGEILNDFDINLKGKHILLVYPALNISTKEAFSKIRPQERAISITEILKKDIKEWQFHLENDFEKSLFPIYPILENIKNNLYKNGALYASMSGSGSTIFGIFDQKIEVDFPKQYLQKWTSE